MKRNTALKWIGWLATLAAITFTPLYREIRIQVLATIAHFQYGLPLPTNMEKLGEFVRTNPDARMFSHLITLCIVIALAMLIGSILAALFGEGKADKSVAPK